MEKIVKNLQSFINPTYKSSVGFVTIHVSDAPAFHIRRASSYNPPKKK